MTTIELPAITAQAREIHPGRAILGFIATVLWMLGAIAWKVLAGVWFVTAWMYVAVRQGWRDARADTMKKRAGAEPA